MCAIARVFLALERSLTKGAWITGGISGVIAIAWLWRKKEARKPIAILFIAVSIVLTIFTISHLDSVKEGVTSKVRKSESVVPRLYMWERVPAGIAENPVFGTGMWQGVSELYRLQPAEEWIKKPTNAIDNQFMT